MTRKTYVPNISITLANFVLHAKRKIYAERTMRISLLVKNEQSLHQIYLDHIDELMCSKKTLYNYVDARLFDIRNIDLPRKVKYRPRYKRPEFKVDRGCRIGRSYADFQKFLENNPETTIV